MGRHVARYSAVSVFYLSMCNRKQKKPRVYSQAKSFGGALSENLVDLHVDALKRLEIQFTSEIIDRELLGRHVARYSAVFVFYLSMCTRIKKASGVLTSQKLRGCFIGESRRLACRCLQTTRNSIY